MAFCRRGMIGPVHSYLLLGIITPALKVLNKLTAWLLTSSNDATKDSNSTPPSNKSKSEAGNSEAGNSEERTESTDQWPTNLTPEQKVHRYNKRIEENEEERDRALASGDTSDAEFFENEIKRDKEACEIEKAKAAEETPSENASSDQVPGGTGSNSELDLVDKVWS